jgi:hypothetical protein
LKSLPWSFYFDVLGLVLNGAALMIAFLVGSIGLLAWHGLLGLFFTIHLSTLYQKLSLETANEHIGDKR